MASFTLRRSAVLFTLIAVFLTLATAPGLAAEDDEAAATTDTEAPVEPEFDPTDPAQILRKIVFPVVGASSYSPSFGACRDGCTRPHEGIDILTYGWKGVPVVAAHDGVITWANIGGTLSGCGLVIEAPDGWSTAYAHLNTDHPGTDDGEAPCFPAGIEVGAWVRAGTIIGWVGDAGNAEETVPHLHFEIRHPEFGPVDPMVSLDAAHRIEHRWVDASDLADLAPALHAEATTMLIVEANALDLVDSEAPDGSLDTEPIDVPLVPYDPEDPTSTWEAIRAIGPERIVVVTEDATASFVEDLVNAAEIVEVVEVDPYAVPPPIDLVVDAGDATVAPEPSPGEGAGEPTRIVAYDPVEPNSIVVLATRRALSSNLVTVLGDQRFVALVGSRVSSDVGATSTSRPGPEALHSGLWWPTAEGWRWSESLDDGASPGMAFVTGGDVTPWTLAYLASRGATPPMPLWHHQPTSLAIKSL